MNGGDWYPFGADLAEDRDFTPWMTRALLHLSERLVKIFQDEVQEMHFILWEQQDDPDNDDGDYHVEACAMGADGYASSVKLADWLTSSFRNDTSYFGQKQARHKALISLKNTIDELLSELEPKKDEGNP